MPEESNRGELEKLIIYAYEASDYSDDPVDSFEVFFNPEELTQVYDVEFIREQGEGTTGSPLVFRKVKPREYSLKFFLDGTGVTGEKIEVDEKIEEFFQVVGYDGEIHRPRYLEMIWGVLLSRCVLLKANITYKMFYPNGRPLRAIIDATFTENIDDSTRVAEARDRSPDLTRVRIVKEGDTLPLMAYQIYGDPSYYLALAKVNRLDHFRELKPGERIFFPPIEKAKK